MKINVEIDCSPEEARRFMGLPDVEKANAVYVDAFANAMKMFQSFVEGARKASETRDKGVEPE